VEVGLSLLGATAVEDRLQEGVADTLAALGEAGVVVWVLTGDKKETSLNICYSCGHLSQDMTVRLPSNRSDSPCAGAGLDWPGRGHGGGQASHV
jgi:magnesium-transporting ATPase (P-type)